MIPFLCNAFNDPSDPWYYVIGVLFLLAVFGALAVYIIWSGKKKKQNEDAPQQDRTEIAEGAESPAVDNLAESVEPKAESKQNKE